MTAADPRHEVAGLEAGPLLEVAGLEADPLLEVAGLEAGYGGSRVLAGVDFALARGEIVGLLGRNGMGKTTLMRALAGLLRPRAGTIVFDGARLDGRAPYEIARRGIASVPQGREIFGDLTVADNLALGVLGHGRRRPGFADPALALFPALAERLAQRAGTLSGGQQQQLAIARALVSEPALLLLDEPSEGIQPSIVAEIADRLAAHARDRGLTLLVVEQNVDMVLRMAGRCLFIEHGRIVAGHACAALADDPAILHRHLAV